LSGAEDGHSRLAAAALAAGSRALGRELSDPAKLTGSDRSVVLRCADRGGTVVVKTYPAGGEGATSFAVEAAGLTVSAGTGLAPRLLAASGEDLTVVMSDLGSGSTMAGVLLADSADDARRTLLDWARACGSLSAATSPRAPEFEALKSRYLAGRTELGEMSRIARSVLEAGDELARLAADPATGLAGVKLPPGLPAELALVADAIFARPFPVFSPGDICPDNNLITGAGIRFLDFESAAVYSAFLDAAYLRMPFSTCWCVFRLPADLAAQAESAYREEVTRVHPPLADDAIWQPGVRRAVAVWTLWTMSWLLPRVVAGDEPMVAGVVSPRRRQLMRHRWQVLAAELDGAKDLPAVADLCRGLLAATEHWQVADLPLYPAFRRPAHKQGPRQERNPGGARSDRKESGSR
jgi:hypothetical protein